MTGPTLAAMSTASPGTRTAADTARLAALDHAHVWHPFTPMRQWCETDPLIIERGEGPYLFDIDGNRYLDGVSSLWCNVHGHRHPVLDQAIRDQLDKVAHTTMLGLASPPSIELAARLVDLVSPQSPVPDPRSLQKVFYSDAGATALEVAFKMAVGYWHHTGRPEKTRFIGLEGAYHGDTPGSMSVGYSDLFHRPFRDLTFPVDWFPNCDPLRSNQKSSLKNQKFPAWPSEDPALMNALKDHSLAALRGLLERQADRTAAIVIEPVMQGAAGMIAQPPGFVRGVRDLASEFDVLLIADEVATGFGRTGGMFASLGTWERGDVGTWKNKDDRAQVPASLSPQVPKSLSPYVPTPDILCLAKGLTAGYLPLAATLTTDAIYDAFCGKPHEKRTLYHGHTYTGNPLACAVALASLDLFNEPFDGSPDLLHHIDAAADLIRDRLDPLRDCPHVADVRQRGIMAGIELGPNFHSPEPRTPNPEPSDFTAPLGRRVCDRLRHRGILLRPLGNVVVLMPIPATPLDALADMVDQLVDVVLTDLPPMVDA